MLSMKMINKFHLYNTYSLKLFLLGHTYETGHPLLCCPVHGSKKSISSLIVSSIFDVK